jgi:alanyl-tRNA synthetase
MFRYHLRLQLPPTLHFEERLEKMRAHTAEHILSGIIYKKYGFENVGFHLGADVVTFDTSAPIEREELEEIEALANDAVMKNAPVRCYFPTTEERDGIFYRSKSEIEDDLRIVEIEGYDSCACCAPHVKSTGEIGLIKIIYSERHKGGTRIYMLAGRAAYEYAAGLYKNAMKISALLCAPVTDIAEETERLYEAKEQALRIHKQTTSELALSYADSAKESQGNAVFYYPTLDGDAIRIFANEVSKKIKGLTVVLTGEDGSLKYIIKSESDDVSVFVKAANEALCGKGGGRGSMAQGSFAAKVDEVKKYFLK